ncbi:27194_t:CDS:2, partial [Racocetra persica]
VSQIDVKLVEIASYKNKLNLIQEHVNEVDVTVRIGGLILEFLL